ncbi:hypothetical protein [Paraburkholderia fungorum]|uniref:hypothetical protein n=1 Tax=Paraburkholderia fungorum TaxID=134537 RepID=UPI003877A4BE
MKTISHKDFRTSPIGGYAGVSSYERRKSGGLSGFDKNAFAIDFERMKKRIHDNDAVRGSALIFRRKRFKLFLKCLEVLRGNQWVPDEYRDDARHNGASEAQSRLSPVENILHRRRRFGRIFCAHVSSNASDGGDDSSAGDPGSLDASKDEPFWPHRRHALYRNRMAHRLAIKQRAKAIDADFLKDAWVVIDDAAPKVASAEAAQ